jgi:hypothetical protein
MTLELGELKGTKEELVRCLPFCTGGKRLMQPSRTIAR